MKAPVCEGPKSVSVKDVPDATIERPTDVLVRITITHRDKAKPSFIVSHELSLSEAPSAYQNFDDRHEGWTKVLLNPTA